MSNNLTYLKLAGTMLPATLIFSACHSDTLSIVEKPESDRPNILFILADDLGYGELSCYNPDSYVKTPHLDHFAEIGVQMTQAYATPVSSPTRSSFLTGKFPQHVGVYSNPVGTNPGIGPFRTSFVKYLQEDGYDTGDGSANGTRVGMCPIIPEIMASIKLMDF